MIMKTISLMVASYDNRQQTLGLTFLKTSVKRIRGMIKLTLTAFPVKSTLIPSTYLTAAPTLRFVLTWQQQQGCLSRVSGRLSSLCPSSGNWHCSNISPICHQPHDCFLCLSFSRTCFRQISSCNSYVFSAARAGIG